MSRSSSPRTRVAFAAAGATGAALWAAQQPIDQRIARSGYDDVELLGTVVGSRSGAWRRRGWTAHLANGALFGLAYSELWRRTPAVSPVVSAQAMAQAENFGLYPLAALVDAIHPARDEISPAFGARQLVQATWRHAILGGVLGVVGMRLARPRP